METTDLILIRVKAFATEVGTLLAVTLLGVLSSAEFTTLITTHFGEGMVGTIGVLVVSGIVKHLMNIRAIKDYQSFGGANSPARPPILI